jgi:hypothetical protein
MNRIILRVEITVGNEKNISTKTTRILNLTQSEQLELTLRIRAKLSLSLPHLEIDNLDH